MSDDRVINLIRTSFVPVALNLYAVREAKGEAGDFFRSVYQQKPQYQGLWLVSPDGRVLAASVDGEPDWTKKVLRALNSGMKEFGTIAPRRPA